jgi:nucleotide-binding universal stress UspA family protein
MYKHILIPTDGSALSKKAVRKGVEFASGLGAKITFFHSPADYEVVLYGEYFPPDLMPQQEYETRATHSAEKILADAAKTAADAGVACDTAFKSSRAPWEAIVEAAHSKRCDLIFMASHGRRGLAGMLLGSETTKVLTHSKIPVLVYR